MITPSPRPALRKAPDANVHPADPTQAAGPIPAPAPPLASVPPPRVVRLPGMAAPKAAPKPGKQAGKGRLSGPPRGTTSDVLRPAKGQRRDRPAPPAKKGPKEKQVELTVKVPKSLRKDLKAAAKSAGRTPDEVVTSLVRAWIDN